jgi:acetyltransferase-like isoleucine patch superfamily enzyme
MKVRKTLSQIPYLKRIYVFFKRLLNINIYKYKLLSNNKIIGENNTITTPINCMGSGKIYCNGVHFGYKLSPFFYNSYHYIDARSKSAIIKIGKGTIINNNSVIIAEKTKILIGENCLIGVNFSCIDSDFHALDPARRNVSSNISVSRVSIGNNVFIGNNVAVLKGVKIGDNVTIGFGSVVTRSIPSDCVACGNPAIVVKKLKF